MIKVCERALFHQGEKIKYFRSNQRDNNTISRFNYMFELDAHEGEVEKVPLVERKLSTIFLWEARHDGNGT